MKIPYWTSCENETDTIAFTTHLSLPKAVEV